MMSIYRDVVYALIKRNLNMNNKVGIYMFTNNVKTNDNGEPLRYIGQSINIEDRYKDHKGRYGKSPMYEDFETYGFENFTFEILRECKEEELDNLEIYYIENYNTLWPNGYNLTTGGSGYPNRATEYTIQKLVEANTGINNPMFGTNEDRLGEKNPMFNKRHSEEARRKIAERSSREIHPMSRKIEDKSGRVWNCVKECSEFLDIDYGKFISALKGTTNFQVHVRHLDLHYIDERPLNYKYTPLEILELDAIPKKKRKYKKPLSETSTCSKKVIDKDGNVYNSVAECARVLNYTRSRMSSFLLGDWYFPPELEHLELKFLNPEYNKRREDKEKNRREFEEKEKPRDLYKPTKTKDERIKQIIDKDGNIYKSVKECSEIFGINQNNLSGMLSGSRNRTKQVIELGLEYLN